MADSITLTGTTREARYQELIPQIKALVKDEHDIIANMSNISAALKHAFGFFWVGFYLVKEGQLVLGPFQGPVACTRIDKGRGVCGTAWARKITIIVEDVAHFPGHIACSAESKSEIVIPIMTNGEVTAVLDVDSDSRADFDVKDEYYLKKILENLEVS
jgi:L-methionine (R)-S-oxide reductase